MFIPFAEKEVISPIQWLVSSKKYLDAVEHLALKDAKNSLQVRQTAPVLTLLAYAYELTLKPGIKLHTDTEKRGHNLIELWFATDRVIAEKIPKWTKEFSDNNLQRFPEEWKDIVLEIDPESGQSSGDFFHNLQRLNYWTGNSKEMDHQYLSRYPQVGIMQDGEVDIRFLHFVAGKIIQVLEPGAMEYHARNQG